MTITENEAREYIQKRIRELLKADAEFSTQRWGNGVPREVSMLMREQSNRTTHTRQELQQVHHQLFGTSYEVRYFKIDGDSLLKHHSKNKVWPELYEFQKHLKRNGCIVLIDKEDIHVWSDKEKHDEFVKQANQICVSFHAPINNSVPYENRSLKI